MKGRWGVLSTADIGMSKVLPAMQQGKLVWWIILCCGFG